MRSRWLVLLGAFALSLFLYHAYSSYYVAKVLGPSMEPTYHEGDALLVSRWREPVVDDVVIVDFEGKGYCVKRIVYGPGDEVLLDYSTVDGLEYWDFLDPVYAGLPVRYIRLRLGEEYVLLGDNRANSEDSRQHGLVGREKIKGVVVKKL